MKLVRQNWPTALVLSLLFGAFVWLTTLTPLITHSIDELGSLDGISGFWGVERIKDANSQELAYSWTKPQASINFHNLPRFAPLEVMLELSLDRPANMPPAELKIGWQDADDGTTFPIATLKFAPTQIGFQRYNLIIPKGNPVNRPSLTIQMLANGFAPGDGRELGVRISRYEVRLLTGWREVFLWPEPYALAVLLFTLGLFLWSSRLELDWQASGLLAAPLLWACAESAQYLQNFSWWLIICAFIFLFAAWLYKPTSHEFIPILIAIFAIIGFFVLSWPAVYDTRYYIDWNVAIRDYGPFGIYKHAQSLNYPPLIVYLLWLYGLIANPLGYATSFFAVKFFLSLSVPALVTIVWHYYRSKVANPAIFLMLGISAGAIYNPVIYGQSDAPLMVFLVWSFILINRGQSYWGAFLAALSLLYKIQAIYLLPFLGFLMLMKSGWRKTALSSMLGLATLIGLSLPAFGFELDEFVNYWSQGQLAGDGLLEYGSYNLMALVDANNGKIEWIVPLSFVIISFVYASLLLSLWRGREINPAFAAGLAILVCFAFAIKVKQHYLYYPLPFLGIASLFDAKLVKPWLLLGGIYTLMLIVTPVVSRRDAVYDNFLTWNRLIKATHPAIEQVLAATAILIFIGLFAYYVWLWKTKNIAVSKAE